MLPSCTHPSPPPRMSVSLFMLQGGVPMPPWVLDSALSHATKRQLQFMYDIGVLAPFMLDIACIQQLEKLDDGEVGFPASMLNCVTVTSLLCYYFQTVLAAFHVLLDWVKATSARPLAGSPDTLAVICS